MDDQSLVSVIIEKDDEDLVDLKLLEKLDLHKKKNKQQYEKIMFSLQLYSGTAKENIDRNRVNTVPEDMDEAFEHYKQTKSFKHFRIDTHKQTATSPFTETCKLSGRQMSFKLSKLVPNSQKSVKDFKGSSWSLTLDDGKKKSIFSIKPKAGDPSKTIYSANASPFSLQKTFKIAPSPGGTTKKRFFINPQPIKSRILDF